MKFKQFTNTKLWETTGLLEGLEEKHKHAVAQLLENQRKINENSKDEGFNLAFKRISIPLLRRAADGVSFNVTENSNTSIQTGIKFSEEWKNWVGQNNLDIEAEYTLVLANEIVEKIKELKIESIHGMNILDDGEIIIHGE